MRNRVIFDRRRDTRPSVIKEKALAETRHREERSRSKETSLLPRRLGAFPDVEKFDSLVRGCRRMLLKISAVFPFDLFPDELIIDECKVSIICREFFFSEDIHSINIEMIKDVDVETGPFFAKLQIVPDGYPGHPLLVRFLRKKDANLARSIIQGLMVAKRNNIDLAKIDDPDLVNKLELLGKTHVER